MQWSSYYISDAFTPISTVNIWKFWTSAYNISLAREIPKVDFKSDILRINR